MLVLDELTSHLQYKPGYPLDISTFVIFKRLATIELQVDIPMGSAPPAEHVSAATKVLRASEYGGRKVIKVRALRIGQDDASGLPKYESVGVEILDIVVA